MAEQETGPEPSAHQTDTKETSLVSIGVMIASVVAALGLLTITGTVGRVQREDPTLFSIALGLVLFAGALWLAASTFTAPARVRETRSTLDVVLRGLAILAGLVGFALSLDLAVGTANNEPRPEITPTLNVKKHELTTEITASSLPTNHRLAFRVDLLDRGELVGHVYQAYVGPNADGNVNQTITTLLPTQGYTEIEVKAYTGTTSPQCDDFEQILNDKTFGSGTGCVIITLPSQAVSPPG